MRQRETQAYGIFLTLLMILAFFILKGDNILLRWFTPRLKYIFERTIDLIEKYHPDEIAIEAPFFGKNVQSMLKLGRAQGVAMAAGLSKEIPITEYSPKKIKMSITGSGNASKEQVAKMLQSLLGIKKLPKNLDSTDGLAAAVCHFYNQNNKLSSEKNYSGWSAFVKQNEKRIKK